jgi:hypothetical protein
MKAQAAKAISLRQATTPLGHGVWFDRFREIGCIREHEGGARQLGAE